MTYKDLITYGLLLKQCNWIFSTATLPNFEKLVRETPNLLVANIH